MGAVMLGLGRKEDGYSGRILGIMGLMPGGGLQLRLLGLLGRMTTLEMFYQ